MKTYYEFIFSIPGESHEAVACKLMELGSTGFFERDGNMAAYFEGSADIDGLCRDLHHFREILASAGLDPAFSFDYALIPGRDWNEEWKKYFRPVDVGDRITIIPSWIRADRGRILIIIDPGMAFGTGQHETTKACLMLIERLSRDAAGGRFLDVGTGTGILAIGAARLGFSPVEGVDNDPAAVEAALHNVRLNGLENVDIRAGSIEQTKGVFDVIAANILSGTLISMARAIADRLRTGGAAVLSGLLSGQEDSVVIAVEKEGLKMKETIRDGKWVTLLFMHEE